MSALIVFMVLGLSQQRDVPDDLNAMVEYRRAADLLSQEPLASIYDAIAPGYESFDLSARRRLTPRIVRVYEAVQSGNARPYAVSYVDPSDLGLGIVGLSQIKATAKALVNYSEVLMADGKPNKAFEVLVAVYIMAGKVGFSADIIHNLVGVAIQAIAVGPMDRNLQQLTLPAAEHILANVPLPESSNDALKALIIRSDANDRARTLSLISSLYAKRSELIKELTDELGRPPSSEEVDDRIRVYENVKLALELASQRALDATDVVDLPEDAWWQEASRLTKIEDEAADYNEFSFALPKAFIRVTLRNRTVARLLRLHAHIAKYYWTHGRLPTSLDQLGQDDAILDPVAGGRFEYELLGEKYDLYSRGFGPYGPIHLAGMPPIGPSDPDDPSAKEKK
ncbi:MAG: hypothetical protein IH944_03995 [Armatimonadetes bacterium]|nr:hypothetical protein [Armatimonadota bacterium]